MSQKFVMNVEVTNKKQVKQVWEFVHLDLVQLVFLVTPPGVEVGSDLHNQGLNPFWPMWFTASKN